MLFLGLEILGGTYLVDRGVKYYKRRKHLRQRLLTADLAVTEQTADEPDENKKIQREADHYLKTSVLAVGAAIVTPAAPILLPITYAAVSYNLLPKLRKISPNKVDNNLLNAMVITTCYLTGHYSIAASMSLVSHVGNKLVNKLQDQSEKTLHNLFADRPTSAWVLQDGQEIAVAIDKLQPGDIVVVNGGEVIPVDGTVSEGTALVDQRALTGETVPAEKAIGESVFAATLIISGKLSITVQQAGELTTIAQINHILGQARNYKGQAQSAGETLADKAAPPILLLSGVTLPFIGIMPAASVLFSSPGNMIKVLSSLQTINHLALLFNQQVLVKDGRVLEDFKRIDTILFDKTGTLTTEQPEVINVFSCASATEDTVLACAAAAEAKQTHPLAMAILAKARQKGIEIPEHYTADNVHYHLGFGVEATLDSQQTIRVGSQRMMTQAGIDIPPDIQQQLERVHQDGNSSLVLVAVNDEISGALEFDFPVREEIRDMISRLKQRGLKYLGIVSGDQQAPTEKLARELGIEHCFYNVLPQDKAGLVERLQYEGHKVCFVGDGVNDSLAMKQANVSISMKGATSVATDLAQVILLDGSLLHIDDLFKVSHNLEQSIRQSLMFCGTYSMVTLSSALLFLLGPAYVLTFGSVQYAAALTHAMRSTKKLANNSNHIPGNEQ